MRYNRPEVNIMDLETVTLLAKVQYKVLEAALMVRDGYTREEITEHLIELAESINDNYPIKKG